MKYPNGVEVRRGDQVELWDGNIGRVVCSIDTKEYGPDYPQGAWEYLGAGVLIWSEKAGLIHYKEPEPSLRLLARAEIE